MNMHAMNMWLTDAAAVVVGADWTLHPWRHNIVGGVTAGQARDNSSNVRGVTVGQVGHNSSTYNDCIQYVPPFQVDLLFYRACIALTNTV